jgi:hypothetical protein
MRRPSAILPVVLTLAACASTPETATDALPMDATGLTTQLATVKDDLDAADVAAAPPPAAPVPDADAVPALKGLGFAQIAGQPGGTMNEKRLMAIRAARLDALRDLAEQVHGIRLSSSTAIRDAVVLDDSLTALVDGTIRGARTVRVTPKGTDSYEVEMMLDRDTVAYIVRALKGRV